MTKLISIVAALVLGVASLAGAAPGQGAMGKAGKEARDKAVKAEKAKPEKAYPRVYAKDQKQAAKRDLKADEQELKRLRKDLKQAQKVGDRRRAQRDRAAISRLEYEIRAERQYIKNNDGRNARLADRRDTRSWWARHLGRNGQ